MNERQHRLMRLDPIIEELLKEPTSPESERLLIKYKLEREILRTSLRLDVLEKTAEFMGYLRRSGAIYVAPEPMPLQLGNVAVTEPPEPTLEFKIPSDTPGGIFTEWAIRETAAEAARIYVRIHG